MVGRPRHENLKFMPHVSFIAKPNLLPSRALPPPPAMGESQTLRTVCASPPDTAHCTQAFVADWVYDLFMCDGFACGLCIMVAFQPNPLCDFFISPGFS